MDAAHFVWGTGFLTGLWSRVRMFVRTSSGRKRHNVLGAYNAVTKKLLTVVNDSYINSDSVCEMLRLLRKSHVGEVITIVLDNAKYQNCKLVQALAKKLRIKLLFLPSYSPNLNLIERLWKFVKKQSLNNCYYETFENFKSGINDCLNNINKKHKSPIASLMTLRFQRFKNEQVLAG
jgi:transposase